MEMESQNESVSAKGTNSREHIRKPCRQGLTDGNAVAVDGLLVLLFPEVLSALSLGVGRGREAAGTCQKG
jgi:hypothetical protein